MVTAHYKYLIYTLQYSHCLLYPISYYTIRTNDIILCNYYSNQISDNEEVDYTAQKLKIHRLNRQAEANQRDALYEK